VRVKKCTVEIPCGKINLVSLNAGIFNGNIKMKWVSCHHGMAHPKILRLWMKTASIYGE
jgi:hypothetical protein